MAMTADNNSTTWMWTAETSGTICIGIGDTNGTRWIWAAQMSGTTWIRTAMAQH